MAKRKIDSSLDGIIINYLKKAKCEKTLKLFEGRLVETREDKNTSKQFWNHLKQNEDEKEIAKVDLGFEINFGAYQSSEPRLKIIPETKRPKNGTDGKREKIEIPKKFMKKIRKLGLREKDADVLYKSKIDWTSVYLGRFSICALN